MHDRMCAKATNIIKIPVLALFEICLLYACITTISIYQHTFSIVFTLTQRLTVPPLPFPPFPPLFLESRA